MIKMCDVFVHKVEIFFLDISVFSDAFLSYKERLTAKIRKFDVRIQNTLLKNYFRTKVFNEIVREKRAKFR